MTPAELVTLYRAGVFPMRLGGEDGPLGWWSPDPRGVLPLDGLVVSRSLRASCRRFDIRVDTAFDAVVEACADPDRSGAWIGRDVASAYSRLHEVGVAHSVEAWQDDELVGGLYAVSVGGLVAGESMFHRVRDASKAALVALVGFMQADGVPGRLLDVQWRTEHLASLGVVDVSREEYARRLAIALELPPPPAFVQALRRTT